MRVRGRSGAGDAARSLFHVNKFVVLVLMAVVLIARCSCHVVKN
jgi:hypothetical protein